MRKQAVIFFVEKFINEKRKNQKNKNRKREKSPLFF